MLILALELCERTLQDYLAERNQHGYPGLPDAELLELVRDAARGLDALNAQGIQHRDVKPKNLLLSGGGVKVGDFGLAKFLEQIDATNTGMLSAAYAAPETFHGRTTAFSDQYSLAVSYLQLLTGRLPFNGSPAEMMNGHLNYAPDLSRLPQEQRPIVARTGEESSRTLADLQSVRRCPRRAAQTDSGIYAEPKTDVSDRDWKQVGIAVLLTLLLLVAAAVLLRLVGPLAF